MKKKFYGIYLIIFYFLNLGNLKCQEVNNDIFALSLEELLNVQITTATQRLQKLSEAPATVISYSSDQIESYGWRDLKDIFRNVTGVDVSYDVQGEVKTLVTFRGIEGNQKILVLQDGQRQNPITGERFIFGHNIPLHIYKRVEIVFGPASALYGADAYAGVVNLITKDGVDVDGISGTLGYVSTNAFVSNLTFGKALSDDVDVIISGRLYYGNDFPYHKHYTDSLDYAAVSQYEGELGSLEKSYPIKNWNLVSKIRYGKLTLGFDWQHQLESNAPSTIPTNYAYVKNNVWGQDVRHLYFNYKILNNNDFALTSNISFGDYAINPISNFFIPIDSDGNGLLDKGSAGYKYGYSKYVEANINSQWELSPKLRINLGSTWSNVISFPKTKNLEEPYHLDEVFGDNLADFVDSQGYTFGLLGLTDSIFGEQNYFNFASYIQAEYKFIDKLAITLGSRFDYNSIYKSTLNPRIGVVYKLNDKVTLKALYGSAFIAPSNYYRWENWANPYAMHIPNLNIKPERVQTIELSGFYYPQKNTSFRFSAYGNLMKDIIRPTEAPMQEGSYPYFNPMRRQISQDPNTGFVETNSNLGNINITGLELDINHQIAKAIISVGYSFTYGIDKETKSKIPKVSQHKLNTSILYSHKSFYGTVTARYYGDVWTATSNSFYKGNDKIPGAIILYASLGYRLKSFSFALNADNILNTKHWNASPYGESIWVLSRAPQALTKLYIGINYKF